MSRASRQNPAVREFILRNVTAHPSNIANLAVKEFGLSRAAISRYLQRLVGEGLLTSKGKTRAREYALKALVNETFTIELSVGLAEHWIWQFRILPILKEVKKSVLDICQYGFTEMLNNAIDHSGSKDAILGIQQTYTTIRMTVIDHGIGIFEKIRRDFELADPRSALLELSKGKLTTAPAQHSGEGIFFTSRMFDQFQIRSGYLFYSRARQDDSDWLIETTDKPAYEIGTVVIMTIATDANWTTREVFEKYANDGDGFRKTHVPVLLARYGGEQLVSRSQAKRVLARFDAFSEVLLDFQGVPEIGQAFADEIFRVFQRSHPDIHVIAINTSPAIDKMIMLAQSSEPTSPVGP